MMSRASDQLTDAHADLVFADHSLLPLNDAGCLAPHIAENLTWTPMYVPACGVLFFSSYTPHRSGPNHTAEPRRAIYLTYNAASEGDLRDAYYRDRDQQLATLGDTAGAGAVTRISTIGHFLGHRAEA